MPRPRNSYDVSGGSAPLRGGYVDKILGAFGLDLSTPGTVDTPRRLLRAIHDATDGYIGDPNLLTAFPTECRGGTDCELTAVDVAGVLAIAHGAEALTGLLDLSDGKNRLDPSAMTPRGATRAPEP